MKRTVLHFSKQEIETLKKIIPEGDSRLANLFPRISSISSLFGMSTNLQVNREEVEAILDLLPPPGNGDPIFQIARQKLTQTMRNMG